MLKLLLCLFSAVLLAVLTLQLRQQRVELSYQSNQLHRAIEKRQAKLWGQQVQIAIGTAPKAIGHTVRASELELTATAPAPAGRRSWIDGPDSEGTD